MPPLTDGSGAEGAHDDERPSGPEAVTPASAEQPVSEVETGASESGVAESGMAESEAPESGMAESGVDSAGIEEAGLEPVASEPEVRRHPSTIGGAFYLLVLAATVVGLVIVALGRWRTGVHWMGGALVVAAAVRAVLPSRDAGMLAVRHRWFDAVLLAGTGVALWILASSIPDA